MWLKVLKQTLDEAWASIAMVTKCEHEAQPGSCPYGPRLPAIIKPWQAHVWQREAADHYVEPHWLSTQLFEVEDFNRNLHLWGPCFGWGHISEAAKITGYHHVTSTDVADLATLGAESRLPQVHVGPAQPWQRRLQPALSALKAAMVFPIPRIDAAWSWLRELPLQQTPRPSMPPGHVIASGEKPGGGKEDFAWLVFERGYTGRPQVDWLHRDGDIL
jgi:hypothetical protein